MWASRPWFGLAALCPGLAALCVGCGTGELPSGPAPALLHSKMASTASSIAEASWMHLPVPPEDGPKLFPLALATRVRAAPTPESDAIGYLRVGENVARSVTPVAQGGCKAGWYAVRPVGFVCQDDEATLKPDHPLVKAFAHGPNRALPLPYSYAFVRAVAPNYLRIPTSAEQQTYEMRLERHLKNHERLAEEWDRMEPGANDVPLEASGVASRAARPAFEAPSLNVRYGGHGEDEVPWWLSGGRRIPNISTFRAPNYAAMAGRIKRHAGVALIDSFVAGAEAGGRRFAVSVDGRLIPADKLKADRASAFHGEPLADGVNLPVAFPVAEVTHRYKVSARGLERVAVAARRQMVALTGKVREAFGARLVEATDGTYLRSQDLKIAPAPSTLPWFATGKTRWIDLSILSQTLVLYEGNRPVYVTLVSSGRDGLGDPKETHSTPTGTFRIYQKHVTTTMDSSVADSEYELRDVPWVMYFQGGYALHAAYWHDDFGRPRSHGCVNLAPIDARYVFNWTLPDVPADWHASYSGDVMGPGTLLHIHK
jgi:lipoprotein-anchoring transpeptidase ErfK/SrfK